MEFRPEMLQRARLSDEALAAIEDELLQATTPAAMQAALEVSTKAIVQATGVAFEGRPLADVTAVSLRQVSFRHGGVLAPRQVVLTACTSVTTGTVGLILKSRK